jgi:hypothetical protein
MSNPSTLQGRHLNFDFFGNRGKPPRSESLKADKTKEASHGQLPECITDEMGVSFPSCVDPQISQEKLFGELRKELGTVFHDLARRKKCTIVEGHLMPDHVHILLSVPPKYAVAQVVDYLKGKRAMYIARIFGGRKRYFTGYHF